MGMKRIWRNIKRDFLRFAIVFIGFLSIIGVGIYTYCNGELDRQTAIKLGCTLITYGILVWRVMNGTVQRYHVAIKDEEIERRFPTVLGSYFSDGPLKKKVYKAIRFMINHEDIKAYKILKKLEKKCSSNGAKSAILFFMGYAQTGHDDNLAIQCYEQARKMRQGFTYCLIQLNALYKKRDELNKAYECLCEAKEWDPDNPQVYHSLTDCLFRMKKFEAAMRRAKEWELIAPRSGEAASYIAYLAAILQDFDMAEQYYRKCMDLDYDRMSEMRKFIDERKRAVQG